MFVKSIREIVDAVVVALVYVQLAATIALCIAVPFGAIYLFYRLLKWAWLSI